MANPNICVDGIVREMTDVEFSQYQAEQASCQAFRDSQDSAAQAKLMQRWVYENTYIKATQSLRKLAGQTVSDDDYSLLSDVQFVSVALTAVQASPIGAFLLTTINYTLGAVKELGGTWETIAWHSEVAAQTPSFT